MYSAPMLVALAAYGASTTFYMLFLAGLWKGALGWARRALFLAALGHLAAIGYHHLSGLPPGITSAPGLINLGVFLVVATAVVLNVTVNATGAGSILAPLATVVLGTLVNNAGVEMTVTHLRFVRFVTPVHIATSAIGFLCFGVAFAASALMILADFRLRDHRGMGWPRLPSIAALDEVAYAAVSIGFPFYTIGIVLGAVWAYWGSPEGGGALVPEYMLGVAVWALFAVLVYVFRTTGWRGRKAAALIMLGFLATIPIVLMYALRRWA